MKPISAPTTSHLEVYSEIARRFAEIVWRRRWVFIGVCALLLSLAAFAKLQSPERFSATGIILPDIRSAASKTGAFPGATFDLTTIVEGNVRMMQSQAFSQQVVERLGLVSNSVKSGVLRGIVDAAKDVLNIERTAPIDQAVAEFNTRLAVQYERRSYLIFVTFTSSTARDAARTANAVIAEFLRSSRIQLVSDQRASAGAALSELNAVYGDSHPLVLQKQKELVALDAALKQAESQSVTLSDGEMQAMGLALPAQENSVAIGASMSQILFMTLLAALVPAAGAAFLFDVWCRRRLGAAASAH